MIDRRKDFERQTDRHTIRQTCRFTNILVGRQTGTQAGRQTESKATDGREKADSSDAEAKTVNYKNIYLAKQVVLIYNVTYMNE